MLTKTNRWGTCSILLWMAVAPAGAYAGQAGAFDTCEKRFAADPEAGGSAQCFYKVAKREGLHREAIRRMERHLAEHPESPWLLFYLGNLKSGAPGAVKLYAAAADLFAGQGEARGEVAARYSLYRILFNQGRLAEAGLEVERTVRAAEESGKPLLIAMAQILQAKHLTALGEDLEQATLLLRRAEEVVLADGYGSLQRDWLLGLGNAHLESGRREEAKSAYHRYLDLVAGDRFAEAAGRYNLTRVLLNELAEVPREEGREAVTELARQALAAATAANHGSVAAKAHWLLGTLASGEEARQHLQRCLAVAPSDQEKSYCLSAMHRHLENPDEAQAVLEQALDLARRFENPWPRIFFWREQMRLSWSAGPPERAVSDSQSALNTIEALRDLQMGSATQAGLFSIWSDEYYYFSGRLLDTFHQGRDPRALEQAFDVTERMRARALIDALEAARAAAATPSPELQLRLAEVFEGIARWQRKLMDPALGAQEKAQAHLERERLELAETDIRRRIDHRNPAFAELRRPDFATLPQVRQSLAGDEALLSFQVAPWKTVTGEFAGGSWLLVSTRNATDVYRLPDRVELRPKVRLFTGLFKRRDDKVIGPSVALYRDLLGAAVDELPAGIRKLIIIPDDEALHRLPFAALRPAPEAEPLAARFQLSLVPSATLWQRWKASQPPPPEVPALALADPVLFDSEDRPVAVAFSRGGLDTELPRLGPLPHARREGRAVVRHLGRGSVLWVGDDASEDLLKSTDLSRFGVLHFATHAVTDDESPRRSAVMLASGSEAEDGLLQIREIVRLKLDGRIVVLSSCRSASGSVLRGEGVMGLARAFFQAGAHTVVASLWPLRDDDAAFLFERFYRYLGEGRSVAAALHAAQRDRIAAGEPAAAWAGLVVLGDGELVPVPGGTSGFRPTGWRLAVVCAALFALLLYGSSLRHRRRGRRFQEFGHSR